MSEKTHAEIIAEMRNRAKRPDFVSQDVLKSCADELEAAHKREIDELRKQVGNAAKLREALVYVNEHTYRDDNDDLREEGCRRIEDVVDEALAAPAGNCDRPECATLEVATKIWIQEEFGPYCNGKAMTVDFRSFDVWAYAPATKKEGGNNAD